MNTASIAYAALLLAGTLVSARLAVVTWRGSGGPSGTRGARAFAAMMAGVAIWCLFTAFEHLPFPLAVKAVLIRVKFLGIGLVPSSWVAFALAFTGRRWWRAPATLVALYALPALTLIVAATDRWTGLLYREIGPWNGFLRPLRVEHGIWFDRVSTPASYGLLALGFLLIASHAATAPRFARRQALLLLGAVALPVLGNIAVIGLDLVPGAVDPTPISLVVAGLLITAGLSPTRLLASAAVGYHTVFRNVTDAVVILDPEGRVLDLNDTALRLAEVPRNALLGRPLTTAFPHLAAPVRSALDAPSTPVDAELRGGVHEIVALPLREGGYAVGHALFARDVTLARSYQRELERIAYLDPLTGVANRRGFEAEAARMLAAARRTERPTTLLWLDLDDFKPINDRFGHAAGDRALVEVARRAGATLRAGDLVARVGGDEFALLLHDAGPAEAEAARERLERALRPPLAIEDGRSVALAGSIGIGTAPDDAADLDGLMIAADSRMYARKAARKAARDLPGGPDAAR